MASLSAEARSRREARFRVFFIGMVVVFSHTFLMFVTNWKVFVRGENFV
jgi:membrane-bound metal-dependent hydrolase YbcI (DUF457 family)